LENSWFNPTIKRKNELMKENKLTKGKVAGVIANLVMVDVDGPVSQNEICYIILEDVKLMAEVIKVLEKRAYIQVFESTRGLRVGTDVEFTKAMLEVTLGPGILSRNYDGLQHDLNKMDGVFLKRGDYTSALDNDRMWYFTPVAKKGDPVAAGDWLGEVDENGQLHKIMVPFKFTGKYKVKSIIDKGEYTINETIAVLLDSQEKEVPVTMVQKWPVKVPIKAYKNKPRPFKLLETGVRTMDTLNPIVEGGTGFIPGPFGSGKTVLQHAISKQAEADIVVVAACGERANEVVEIFAEFPEIDDPRTGRKLMERTTIIANTSNMPVAAREASVYTAMTLAEYYRAMGLRVLLLADSTSRWAQALREMSNRMEELPGPDAFPMDLPAIISNFYSRAGYVYLNNGESGSITFIGTVSPAGGNLKEPVTESTKKAARCFYALSQQRADSKRYPAIDPIDSYSKYIEYPELQDYLKENVGANWVENVLKIKNILIRGKEASEQINILGDDGVPIGYHVDFWKSEVIDFVILQQDAFDEVDRSSPIHRQKYMLEKVLDVYNTGFEFGSFEEVNPYFKRIINEFKQMNFSDYESDRFYKHEKELFNIIDEKKIA
jgi:V/A-type H+/Na+-transporting ATPase subunit A